MSPVTAQRPIDSLRIDLSRPVQTIATQVGPLTALRDDWLRGDNALDVDIGVRMHPVTLRFDDKDLEREFAEEYHARTLVQVRLALVVGMLLYGSYGLIDFLLAPLQRPQIWII